MGFGVLTLRVHIIPNNWVLGTFVIVFVAQASGNPTTLTANLTLGCPEARAVQGGLA